MPHRRLPLVLLVAAVCVGIAPIHAAEPVLYEQAFKEGAAGWQAVGAATVSDVYRRPGGRSLLIRQWADDQQTTQWLSPQIEVPQGKAVTISFWAADNYLRCGDFTYSACVNAIEQGYETDYLATIVWDEGRKGEMWGQLLPEGLVWKYYEATYRPRTAAIQLKFHWPKPLLRGDCYLTDVRVAVTDQPIAAREDDAPVSSRDEMNLEISAPVTGNIFHQGVPLRFEILLYGPSPQSLPDNPSALTLAYDVTDFQRFEVANGHVAFTGALPLGDSTFYESRVGKPRRHNLHRALTIDYASAREPGREWFLRVRLLDAEGRELAQDTMPYMVASPHDVAPGDAGRARFAASWFRTHYTLRGASFHDESIAAKLGITWDQDYDYWWSRVQPHVPGPMDFDKPRSATPYLTFCPNIEQERAYPQWIRKFCPPEVVIDDPLRPKQLTFEIDPYVDYMVAWLRHNRHAVARVVPSGLERPIDARTIELHRKAYAAIKAEFPDLPVGFMLYGLPMNPSADVDIFLDNQLYECTDFIDTHIYSSAVDWSEWERLQAAYRSMGREPPPLYSTEFARVGGADQVDRARNLIASHLDAFAHGMSHIYYFNRANEEKHLADPFLREPTNLGGNQVSGFMFMQQLSRPRVSPLIEADDPKQRWQIGGWGNEYGGTSLVPTLSTAAYHNLVRNFDLAAYRRTLRPTPGSIAYVFDRDDRTIAALWQTNPADVQTFRLRTSSPVRLEDLYGRDVRLTPIDGEVLITVGDEPLTLIFDGLASDLSFEPVDAGLRAPRLARGGEGELHVTLPAGFAVDRTISLVGPDIQHEIATVAGESAAITLPLKLDASQPTGTHPLAVTLTIGDDVVGVMRCNLEVGERLDLDVRGEPMAELGDPAIAVTVINLDDAPSRGVVRLVDRWFSADFTPRMFEQSYEVPPRSRTTVRFRVLRALVNLTTAYTMDVTVQNDAGLAVTRPFEVHFRGAFRATAPISVDGDLSDWALDEMIGVPFVRTFTNWGASHEGPADCSGVVYCRWDDERLYFAAVVRDDSFVQRFADIDMWQDDNIMLGLYPWGWQLGQPLNSGFYREHLGLCADGAARIFRVGNVGGGPVAAEGATIAARYDGDRLIYEWAYPSATIFPLRLTAGSRFRASVFSMDRDAPAPPEGEKWPVGGVSLGAFNTNVNARPEKWREFVLVE